MRKQPIDLGTLTIASGQTASGALELKRKPLRGIAIYAPATLPETVNIGVSADGGATYQTLQSAGTDIVIGADKCVVVDAIAADFVRLESGITAANRAFVLMGYEDMT